MPGRLVLFMVSVQVDEREEAVYMQEATSNYGP